MIVQSCEGSEVRHCRAEWVSRWGSTEREFRETRVKRQGAGKSELKGPWAGNRVPRGKL